MSLATTVYSRAAGSLHWLTAVPLIGTIGSVLKAQQAPKEDKGKWMFRHKSLGLLTGMIIAPRFAYRLVKSSAYRVIDLPGSAAWENQAAHAGHYFLYAFMTVMPATGIAMGYYGGKGLPFFYTTFAGAEQANGKIAKQSFQVRCRERSSPFTYGDLNILVLCTDPQAVGILGQVCHPRTCWSCDYALGSWPIDFQSNQSLPGGAWVS